MKRGAIIHLFPLTLTAIVALAPNPAWPQALDAALGRAAVGDGYSELTPGEAEAAKKRAASEEHAVPMGGQEAESAAPDSMPATVKDVSAEGDQIVPGYWADPARMSPVAYRELYETAGYIGAGAKGDGEVIDGHTSSQVSFASAETVYINLGESKGVKEGDLYEVFHAERDVAHPVTGAKLGQLVVVDAVVRVTKVTPDNSSAEIIRAYETVERGDQIRPYKEVDIPTFDPDRPVTDKKITGYLVSCKLPKEGYATGDIIYLDVGSASGAEPGDVFNILDRSPVLRRDGSIVKGLPKVVGRVRILSTQDKTSAAVIYTSVSSSGKGDPVEFALVR